MSEHAARAIWKEVGQRPGVETELIDVAELQIPVDDAGEQAKDPAFAKTMNRADALIIVTPEYNHGYAGLLKHVLDTNLKEYIHKAAGVVGVSAGVFGGARAIENLLPVLRELGLVTVAFAALTVALTYPLAFHPGTISYKLENADSRWSIWTGTLLRNR